MSFGLSICGVRRLGLDGMLKYGDEYQIASWAVVCGDIAVSRRLLRSVLALFEGRVCISSAALLKYTPKAECVADLSIFRYIVQERCKSCKYSTHNMPEHLMSHCHLQSIVRSSPYTRCKQKTEMIALSR